VRVFIKRRDDASWSVTQASVQCMQGKQSNDGAAKDKPLFDNTEIASCHFRTCLLDPLFFSVVNKQIVRLISNSQVSQRLRSRAI